MVLFHTNQHMFLYLTGTTPGGNDVYSFENVGVVQHKALHGLSLQNGYVYYATLKGNYSYLIILSI